MTTNQVTNLRGRPLGKFSVIREADFAHRLAFAADEAGIPGLNQGRLTTVRQQLMSKYNEDVALESVRKWFAGESRPRTNKMRLLAKLLNVDEGWLALGTAPAMTPKERHIHRRVASGAVHVLAGHIMLAGGNAIYPDAKDPRGQIVDLYAIIENSQVPIHVSMASVDGNDLRFALPHDFEAVEAIGAVRTGPLGMEFWRIPEAAVREHGVLRQGHYELAGSRKGKVIAVGNHQLDLLRTPEDLLR